MAATTMQNTKEISYVSNDRKKLSRFVLAQQTFGTPYSAA
jgi:hypothetical protein